MTTLIEEWQGRIENIENATSEERKMLMFDSLHWPKCAVGALLCDKLDTNPYEIDVDALKGFSLMPLEDKLAIVLPRYDMELYELGVRFHDTIAFHQNDAVKETLEAIKSHEPTPELLARISKRKDA